MRFYFTHEDRSAIARASEIRAALVHAGHLVRCGTPSEPAPGNTSVWFHGLGIQPAPPLDAALVDSLMGSSAEIVLFQVCDHHTLSFERIPDRLSRRTRLFLRNHWPSNDAEIPEPFRDRLGLLPPMIKPMAAQPGRPLHARAHGAIFFGSRTGFTNLAGERNAREEAVRLMRASGLPFLGGVLPHAEERYRPAPELMVPRISEADHVRLLQNAKVCIAPWGNHQLTYRFFEGLAFRCLVVAQSLRATRFLDGELVPGRHYVEAAPDLNDLTDIVRHYLARPDEAQRIADAGHEVFRARLASRGKLVSSWIFDATVASWKGLYPGGKPDGLRARVLSVAARVAPRLF